MAKSDNLKHRIGAETIMAGVLTAIGGGILAASGSIGWGNLLEPQPGMYPGIVGLMIMICAVLSIFGLRATEEGVVERQGIVRVAKIFGAFLIWCLGMPYLGYLTVTFVTSVIIGKTMGYRTWKMPVIISGALTLATFLLFDVWFYVDLPRGFWEEIL